MWDRSIYVYQALFNKKLSLIAMFKYSMEVALCLWYSVHTIKPVIFVQKFSNRVY